MTVQTPPTEGQDPGKSVAILQSNYIPWKGYFDIIGSVDEFIIYDSVQYTKNDWRNRNKIKSLQGELWLTIPVQQKHLHQLIRDTEISSPVWAQKHWKSISNGYAKAPCFRDVKDFLGELYDAVTPLRLLSDVNLHFLTAICSFLGITTRISSSEAYPHEGDRNERLIHLIRASGATRYLSGPAASGYLDPALFQREGISVSWIDYTGYPEYPQLFPPFNHYVSIIDLLVSTGSTAPQYLKSSPPLSSTES